MLNLNDFKYSNQSAISDKLARFKTAGVDNIHVCLDFDRTLTVSKNPSVEATTWQVMERHMSAEGKAAYASLFRQYRPHELNGTLTQQLAEEWWEKSLQLLVDYKVNLKNVESTFMNEIVPRKGTQELFVNLGKVGIPSIILSAGIKDVIEIFLATNNIPKPLVIATELTIDDKDNVSGWRAESLVHVLNKNEATHSELTKLRDARPYCIVIGDSLDDANMAEGEDNVLRIRIIDQRADEDIEKSLSQTFSKFDLAVIDGNLDDTTQLIEYLTK